MQKYYRCGKYVIYRHDEMNWVLTVSGKHSEPDLTKRQWFPTLTPLAYRLLDLMVDDEPATGTCRELIKAIDTARDEVSALIVEFLSHIAHKEQITITGRLPMSDSCIIVPPVLKEPEQEQP